METWMVTIWRCSRRASAARPDAPRVLALAALTLLAAVGCNGDDDGGVVDPGVVASFVPSATVAAPNLVRMRAGSASDDLVTVQVVLAGPTTSNDIYSFAFDLLLSDPSVARYEAGSAVVGGALVPSLGQGTFVQAASSGTRVVVGVTKTGGGAGNAVASGEPIVVSLTFRLLDEGTSTISFAGSPSNPQNPTATPAALDSSGNVIGSITFDTLAGTLIGS
jgi:hypothetical protein